MKNRGMAAKIRVVVVDDQAIVRSGLRMILEAQLGIEVIGEASDGETGITMVNELKPDVVLMDIRMPVRDGISATREILKQNSDTRVIMLTTYAVDENVVEALLAGASGFFAKTDEPREIIRGVTAALDDLVQLGPSVMKLVLDRYMQQPRVSGQPPIEYQRLTDREREVLVLLGKGTTNAEIAESLFLSEATIKTHVSRILTKLHLRDRTQAAVYCYEHGLIRPA